MYKVSAFRVRFTTYQTLTAVVTKHHDVKDKCYLLCHSTNNEKMTPEHKKWHQKARAPEVITLPSGMGFLPQEKLDVECRMSLA